MARLKQFITARRISLGLILLLAAVMYISTVIPQRIDATQEKIDFWRRSHSGLLWLIDGIQLHGIYSQPWFAAIILFAAVSLGVSSFDQWQVARIKRASTGIRSSAEIAGSVSARLLESVARAHHYREIRLHARAPRKFVRNPWGYFGVLLLHSGMTLVIAVSLFVSLTGRQGALILVEGAARDMRQPWDASEHGLLASPLQLPGSILLARVRVGFNDKNQPTDVASDISFTNQTGAVDTFTASINRITLYKWLRIYHAAQYGDTFSVLFTDPSGRSHMERIFAQQSTGLEKAGYSSDFRVTGSPYLYAVKYYADADKKSMSSANPQLVMRMLDGSTEIARAAMTLGSTARLGDYRLQLVKVEKWAKLIMVDISGMSAVFAGFAVIMLGGVLCYMTPPRELIGVMQADGTYRVHWRASAFKDFYLDERDGISEELKRENDV
jgi:hypothetical protein